MGNLETHATGLSELVIADAWEKPGHPPGAGEELGGPVGLEPTTLGLKGRYSTN